MQIEQMLGEQLAIGRGRRRPQAGDRVIVHEPMQRAIAIG
jgi:hypothetical protein